MTEQETPSFEKAFDRLEEILETMNSGAAGLDESIKLFEEADRLLTVCSKQLSQAERKVEQLLKARNGELVTDNAGHPRTEPFTLPSHGPKEES